jgi:hypothetical protein
LLRVGVLLVALVGPLSQIGMQMSKPSKNETPPQGLGVGTGLEGAEYVGEVPPTIDGGVYTPEELTEEELAEWYGSYFPRWGDDYEKRAEAKDVARSFTTWADEKGIPYNERRQLAMLMTAQGQQEGAWAGKGRSTKFNPLNVGEFDKETTQSFGSTEEGIRGYLELMYNNYRPESGNYSDLMNPRGFVNRVGNRYASDPNYEKNVKGIMRMLEEGKQKGFGPYPPFPK